MKIIALVNPLGGTGKAFTAYALSCGLAMRGFKVLAVDAEWQNKLSELCGVDAKDKRTITYLMKNGRLVSDEVLHPVRDGLTIIPSDLDLLRTRMEYGKTALKRALESYDALFDYCIINSPPYNGPWMESILTAAH